MLIKVPLPIEVVPHDPAYHLHDAPSPKKPPLRLNVIGMPGQAEVLLVAALAAGVDNNLPCNIIPGDVKRQFTFVILPLAEINTL